MSKANETNRLNSLLVPWFSDGALSIVFAAGPLLASKQGASVLFLGIMGIIAHGLRLPICLVAGRLSERIGRKQVTIPAAMLTLLGCVGLMLSTSVWTTCVFFAICVAAMGAFYPPLQAFIGEVSGPGSLAKNLGAFNAGWCVGSAVAAQIAAVLLKVSFQAAFAASIVMIIISMAIIGKWRKPEQAVSDTGNASAAPLILLGNDYWLLIARFGHFTGFFGYACVRMIFIKTGESLNWTAPQIASITGFMLWGMGLGIFITALSPWWRGKIVPQLTAHVGMAASALGMAFFSDKLLLRLAFLVFGTCLAMCYTTAIYHGLAARSKMGRNMGIHEALVAGGQVSGSIMGGFAAQYIGLRSPYFILAGIALAAFAGSIYVYLTKLTRLQNMEATV